MTMGSNGNNGATGTGGGGGGTGGNLQAPVLAFVFAASGAGINLFQQQLYYAGAGNGNLLILIVPTFVGMAIGGLSSEATRKEIFTSKATSNNNQFTTTEIRRRMKQFVAVSITDVTSLTLRSWSQNLCGSGMFTVIYASLPAFNGILTYFFLGRVLNMKQWISMFVVIVGLAFAAEAEEDSVEGNQKALGKVISGIIFGIAGTFFSSASYICAERVLKGPDAPQHPTTLTAVNGINDIVLTLPWILFYSIPHREQLLYKPVAERGENPYFLVFIWLCLVASNAAHLNACYMLLRITESVTLTMLQGVRAVMVFAISGLFFCRPANPEQCLTTQKVLCSFVVLAGVIMYAKSTAGLSKHMSTTNSKSTPTTPTAQNDDEAMIPLTSSNNHHHAPPPLSSNSTVSGSSSTAGRRRSTMRGKRSVQRNRSFDSTGDSTIRSDDGLAMAIGNTTNIEDNGYKHYDNNNHNHDTKKKDPPAIDYV